MPMTPTAAAQAYASLARLTDPTAAAKSAPGISPSGPSFQALVKEAIGSVVEAGRKSDMQAQAVASGKANIVDVVTAVAETEVAIETLVSVRDRVIQSYDEIMKMPI